MAKYSPDQVRHQLAQLRLEIPATYVPVTRTINGYPLSSNIILAAADVGADPSGTAAAAIAAHNAAYAHTDIALNTAHRGAVGNPHGLTAGDIGAAGTAGTLAQFAATTSLELAGVISDETGSGLLVFATSPDLTTPNVVTAIYPKTTDGAALGSTALMWADLFLASGGVINWNNGSITLTHITNTLRLTSAASNFPLEVNGASTSYVKFLTAGTHRVSIGANGAGLKVLNPANVIQFSALSAAGTANYPETSAAAAGSSVTYGVDGSDTDIGLIFSVKNIAAIFLNGGVKVKYVEKAIDYTLTKSDFAVAFTSGTRNAPLPAAATVTGQLFAIKCSTAAKVTIDPDGAETIEGAATLELKTGDGVLIISTGSAYIILCHV